ncbi:MAG: hypothetical protein JXR05_02000 [Flavobacteriaceae bacterium]
MSEDESKEINQIQLNKSNNIAVNYFQSYVNYFWQWEVDYSFNSDVIQEASDFKGGINCLSIPNGIKIAYKEQIKDILESLSEVHFPPFGAIVLAFLATNNYDDTEKIVSGVFDKIRSEYPNLTSGTSYVDLTETQAFLKTLIKLEKSLKVGDKRTELFTIIFKEAHNSIKAANAQELLKCIENKAFELEPCANKKTIVLSTLTKDFNTLALLNKKFPNPQAIVRKWQGLPEIEEIEEVEIDSNHIKEKPDFIQQLIEEPKTFFVGNLLKRLWSGIQLPMQNVHPGEMPLGGVSDITNKGDFNNLLITEYANDNDVFLHRIANKEALFIRRETTPEEDLRTRAFLIDTTIKNWGTPKILSYATALSFIYHPKNKLEFRPYAVEDEYHELNFETVEGVIDGLQSAFSKLDASKGVELFLEEHIEEDIEITFFTSKKTLQHNSFVKLFNQHHDKFGWIITTDTVGGIDVFKIKNGTKNLVRSIVLPIEELWRNPPKQKIRKGGESEIPDEPINNYPILFGLPSGKALSFKVDGLFYILQKRGNFFRARKTNKGFELLSSNIRFHSGIKTDNDTVGTIIDGEITILYWDNKKNIVLRNRRKKYVFQGDYEYLKNHYSKYLTTFKGAVYLSLMEDYTKGRNYYKIHVEDNYIEEIKNLTKKDQKEFEKKLEGHYIYYSGSVFSNIRTIKIRKDNNLVFNDKHTLNINLESIRLTNFQMKMGSMPKQEAILEGKHFFSFVDGSKILIDRLGILTFKSSNPSIETFYMSSFIDISLAMASETEFAGNNYFLPEETPLTTIKVSEFQTKYVTPFIENIVS